MSYRDFIVALMLLGVAPALAQEKPAPRLPSRPPAEIVERVRAELNDDADLQDCLQGESEEPVNIEELLFGEAIDLGAGHHGMVVRGSGECLCSPAGNCEVWVFELGTKPTLLLRATAVQEVTLKDSASNGYRDLVTSVRSSSGDSDVSTYHFDGKEYRLKECMRRTWTDEQGRRLKQPRLIAGGCERQ